MDITAYLAHGLTAVVTGVGSVYTSFAKVRSDIAKLKDESVQHDDINEWKHSIIQGLRLEWEQLKNEIERDRRGSNPNFIFEELGRRLESMQEDVDKIKDRQFVDRDEFNAFIQGNTRQWNEINRLIGEIRGEMKSSHQK